MLKDSAKPHPTIPSTTYDVVSKTFEIIKTSQSRHRRGVSAVSYPVDAFQLCPGRGGKIGGRMKIDNVSQELYTWVMFISGIPASCRGLYANQYEAYHSEPKQGMQVKFHLFKVKDILDRDLEICYISE